MKQYLISKESYKGDVVNLNIGMGYKVNPKKDLLYEGVKVQKIVFIKPELIKRIIKRKIKNKLDIYINYLISDEDDSGTRRALGDLQRYRYFVKYKYYEFLDKKYIVILNNKLDILERNLKSKVVNQEYIEENVYGNRSR